ncbi:MAG: methyltransferase domain-containing protein [Actinobacteria bacterium]|nr:MAG: methyltransferase domain-containing protein [Actinomycetota bacterium]
MAVRRRSSRSARGQHFLRSSRLAAALVRDAGVARDDLVVDVGAGTGMLTRALQEAGARVVAVERDPSLAAGLRARFSGDVSIVQSDVLDWKVPAEPFAVVANLPFAGSGAILSRLLRGPVTRAAVVEWAFAQKQAAVWPTTLKGAYWRAFYEVEIVRRLDRTAFAPPPSVDAAVLCFNRRAQPLVPTAESQRYWRFLSEAFHAGTELRRSVLTPLQAKRLAPTLGFRPNARPRELDACQWAGVYASFRREASGVRWRIDR